MADITITHTRADGTLIEGSSRGDGVFELLKPHGFRYFRSIGCLGLPRSRDKQAMTWKINPAADALRNAGHTVTITIDEDNRRSFADAEADRIERAEQRTDRYAARAARASEASDAAWEASHRGLPPGGEPIKIGHHSENRHRRALERAHQQAGKAVAEGKRGQYWAGRAEAAAHYEQHRNNPGTTLRRINNLEADLRRVERNLDGTGTQGWNPNNPDHAAELNRRKEEITEQLDYWRAIIAKAEADGLKVWTRADFKRGDFARIRGRWYEVLRVNAKTLTVPGGPDIKPVITQENRAYSWDDRAPYDEVSGRKSAEEMQQALAAAEQPAA